MNSYHFNVPDEKIEEWYNKAKKFKFGLQDHIDIYQFGLLLNNGIVYEYNFGIFYLTDLNNPPGNAYVHALMWDRRTKGREWYAKELIKKNMDYFELHRLTACIPAVNRATTKWLMRIGFTAEGYIRAYMVFNNQLYDMLMLGYYSDTLKNYISLNYKETNNKDDDSYSSRQHSSK